MTTIAMKCDVDIVVRDPTGNIVHQTCLEDDLATEQWMEWFSKILTGVAPNGSVTTTMIDNTAASQTVGMFDNGTGTSWQSSNSAREVHWRIAVGDGNGSAVTAARTDRNLVRILPVGGTIALNAPIVSAPSTAGGVSAISATITNGSGSSWTVREVGLYLQTCNVTTSVARYFLMFHDATADTVVANGNTVTVTYKFTFA